MARNTECLTFVLDVRSCTSEEFKLKSVKCVAEILKDKIVSDKKDYVSFVLIGCEKYEKGAKYEHVVHYEDTPQLCSWQHLLKFFESVIATPCMEGEWLHGLAVAMELQERAAALKVARRRILLLFDFNDFAQKYDEYNDITNSLLKADIDLIVGTHNIAYIDNAETNLPQAIFKPSASRKSNGFGLENQKHALQLVTNCNATLCNFKEALATVFKVSNRHPWTWAAKLHIGTAITINLQGIIAIKHESRIKLKKVWADKSQGEEMEREERFFIKGTEVTPMPEDLIEGFMLGGTPVPYDKTIVEQPTPHPPGLHFLGFVKRDKIPDAYFCGDSLYMMVHQKHNTTSAKKLDALVRALILQKSVILCWKIFSAHFNKPHIVVLMPQKSTEDRPATLYMQEISYHAQHQFWDFPALHTAKTECSPDQMQAIDKLIDSMDLECTLKDTQQPRQQRQNDLLPFDSLPSIYDQNVMDVLERRVIRKNTEYVELNSTYTEKKFVENYWCVPEPIEEKAKRAASELKKLFPLEQSLAWLEKLKAMEAEQNAPPVIKTARADRETSIDTIESIGLMAPVQDFNQLLTQVRLLSNTTQRDAQFQSLAAQMRVVIITLLERNKLNLEELVEVLTVYRKSCLEFHSFAEFNQFATQIKEKASDKNLEEFWQRVMVEKQLGPLVLGEPTLEDEIRLKAYYTLSSDGNNDCEMKENDN